MRAKFKRFAAGFRIFCRVLFAWDEWEKFRDAELKKQTEKKAAKTAGRVKNGTIS